jgi:ABC-type lipoprotein release transport system permease subunit
MISAIDAKEIAILRSVGWSIQSVIWLKFSENFIVAFYSYLVGVILAYFYVFVLNAPLLRDIFLGYSNLSNDISFSLDIDAKALIVLFLFFVVPFIVAIIIPLWRVSTTEPTEIMR